MFKSRIEAERHLNKNIKEHEKWIRTGKPYTGNKLERIKAKLAGLRVIKKQMDAGERKLGHYSYEVQEKQIHNQAPRRSFQAF